MEPIVDSLFAELTVLGFIGLVAFGLGKSGLLEKVGDAVHQEELPELFETLHMALFATMVVFIIEVFVMLKAASHQEKQWDEFEGIALNHEAVLGLLRDWEECEEAEAWMTKNMTKEQKKRYHNKRSQHNMPWPRGMAVEVFEPVSKAWAAGVIEGEVVAHKEPRINLNLNAPSPLHPDESSAYRVRLLNPQSQS